MSEFKGTPGKWFYQEESDAYTHIVRPEINLGRIISHLAQDTSGEAEANARLIAAAPELLEALELLLSAYQSDGTEDFNNIDVEQKAEAAIAKALGKEIAS